MITLFWQTVRDIFLEWHFRSMSNFESHELWRRGFTPKSKPIKPPPSDQAMKDEVEKSHNFEDSYHHVLK